MANLEKFLKSLIEFLVLVSNYGLKGTNEYIKLIKKIMGQS